MNDGMMLSYEEQLKLNTSRRTLRTSAVSVPEPMAGTYFWREKLYINA